MSLNLDALSNTIIDDATGVHIGEMTIGEQRLRVGVRPVVKRGRGAKAAPAGGPPLLVFNGIGANLELAGPLMARMANIETIIFDVPGAGKSPAPRHPYRLSFLTHLACEVLKRLGVPEDEAVDVMGVSWGGGLAQEFAIQHNDRVRRLILAATSMGAVMVPGKPSVLMKMASPKRYTEKGYMKRIAPDLYGGDLRSNPEAIKLFTDHAKGGDQRGYQYQLLAMIGWTSLPWLWRIRQPTLVLAGNDDPLIPLINARMHAMLLPDARLHVFDDGHLFLLTRAAETAQIIDDFLQEAA